VVGLLVATFAAAIAYFFYAAAVVLLAGFVGYQLGIGVMAGLGFQEGWLTFLVGLVVGLAWVAVAIYLHFAKVLVLILTALAGAELLLGGVLLALGRISLTGLRFGAVGAFVRDSWFWGLLYLAIAALGFYVQWRTTQNYVVEEYAAENPFTIAETTAGTDADAVAATAASAAAAPALAESGDR
jgi:nitrate reductase gamma subunit